MSKKFSNTIFIEKAKGKEVVVTEDVTQPNITASGYSHAGASYTKNAFKGFTAESINPKLDIDFNNHELRSRARMLTISSPIATSAIRTLRTNVVGTGIVPKPRLNIEVLGIDADTAFEIQKQIEREWELWSKDKFNCDATGVNDFYGMQQLAYRAYRESGDCFVLFKWQEATKRNPYSLRLHILEADRISTPNQYPQNYHVGHFHIIEGENPNNGNPIYDGVEIDKATGSIVAYWVCNSYPDDYTDINAREWIRVEAIGQDTGMPNILQLMESDRPEQYRGVSILAPVMERVLQVSRYSESVVATAVLHAKQTMMIETNADPSMLPFPKDKQPKNMYTRAKDVAIGNGAVNVLKPGEKMTAFKPEQPTTSYEGYLGATAKEIGAALEIPKGQLLKEFNSSYSATRGELLEFQKFIKMNQQWFISDFCKPVYERWFTEAVALGRIKAPGYFNDPIIRQAYLNCEWIVPSFGQIDPTKEVQALSVAVANRWLTNEAAARQYNGSDFYHNVVQVQRELEAMGVNKIATIQNEDKEDDNEEENPDDVDNDNKQEDINE